MPSKDGLANVFGTHGERHVSHRGRGTGDPAPFDEGVPIYGLLREAGHVKNNSDARRLIRGGGARVREGTGTIGPADLTLKGAIKLSAGRKRHVLVRPA